MQTSPISNYSKKSYILLSLKILLSILISIVLISGGFLLWQHYYPVVAKDSWEYKVIHDDIAKASALYKDQFGNLIVAEELNDGKGRILNIAPDGKRTVLFDKLNKPDGMTPFQGGIVFSQEAGTYPVYWLVKDELRTLFEGTNIQGLTPEGRYLYAVEDRGEKSRILRYDSETETIDVIRTNLNEAETLAICPNGSKFYNEKESNRVRQLTEDGTDPIILDETQVKEPSFLKCDARGLWIAEDSTHRARLLLLKPNGKLRVILTHLKAPQQLLQIDEDKYYLAEGGRDRVIEIQKTN